MAISRGPVSLAVAVLLGSNLLAQEAGPRGRFAGWVRGDDGQRVVGADVTLLSRPLPQRPDLGVTDELHVRTAADGMFRTELLHGRAYTAWAVWRDGDGHERRTRVLEGVFPGPPRALEAAPPQTLDSIRIVGSQAWQDRAPLTVTAFTQGENVASSPLRCDAEMVAEMPTMPGDWCSVEVRCADGLLVGFAGSLQLTGSPDPVATIELPPPRKLRVAVVDENGEPLQGVGIRHAFGHHHRDLSTEVGRTAAEGVVDLVVPAHNPMYGGDSHKSCAFVIEARGRQRIIAWSDLGKIEQELRLTMPTGIELTGRVVAADGSPARGVTLLPDCYAMGSDADTTGSGVPLRALPLDEQGRFTFCSLHPRYDFRLLAMLDPAAASTAGMRVAPDIALAPVMWLAVGRPPFGSPHDLGDIRLDEIAVAQIEVRTHAGVPVPGAHLSVTTNDLYNSPIDYVCDRVGRLQFPLPKGEIRIGAWVPGGGVVTTLVRVPVEEGDPAVDPLVLKLSPTRTVRGIVVDVDGKPVADAVVYQWDRAKTDDRAVAALTFLGRATSEPTGADGAFTLTLPLDDVPFAVRAFGRVGEARCRSNEVVVMPDDPHGDRLRIEIAPAM